MRASDLTADERFVLSRRRSGLSQEQVAVLHKVCRDTVRRWEAGELPCPSVRVGRLAVHEQCFLMRRRFGWTRRRVAEELGVSEYWITQMERGKAVPSRLARYWGVL